MGVSVAAAHEGENPNASNHTRLTRWRGGRGELAGDQIVKSGDAVSCDGPSGGSVVVRPQRNVRHHVGVGVMELEVVEIGGEGRAVPARFI